MDKQRTRVSLSRTVKMIIRVKCGFFEKTQEHVLEPKCRQANGSHGDWLQGLESHQESGQPALASCPGTGSLSFSLLIYFPFLEEEVWARLTNFSESLLQSAEVSVRHRPKKMESWVLVTCASGFNGLRCHRVRKKPNFWVPQDRQ